MYANEVGQPARPPVGPVQRRDDARYPRRGHSRVLDAITARKPNSFSAFTFERSASSSPRGFTLLEVMVALSIMAIVLVSVYRMQSQTLAMTVESRFYTQAPLLARGALSRFEESRERVGATNQGDFGREFPGYQWKITVEDVTAPSLGAELSRDLKRIDVLVTLNSGEFSYTFRTYRFKRE